MADIFDWSTTASSNTTCDGININTGMPVGNVDNALRSIMALVRNSFSTALEGFLNGTAALPITSGGTGAPDAATARTNLGIPLILPIASGGTGGADAATARTNLGVAAAPAVIGGPTSGRIVIGGGFVMTWRDHTVSAGTTACAYGDGYVYSSWARAWMEGDDNNSDVSASISSQTTSAAMVRSVGNPMSIRLFSIGV